MRSEQSRTSARAVRPATSPRPASHPAVSVAAGPSTWVCTAWWWVWASRASSRPCSRDIASRSSNTDSPASRAFKHPIATPSMPPVVASVTAFSSFEVNRCICCDRSTSGV